jgi:hypothetical protein
MAAKTDSKKKKPQQEEVAEDFSLNDVLLRGRVSQEAIEKELPRAATRLSSFDLSSLGRNYLA